MRVLIPGANGMVARAVIDGCEDANDQVFTVDRNALDISDTAAVFDLFDRIRPEVVINTAAWTDVDGCESDIERAYAVNARGPANLAVGCRRIGAGLVTVSTDYVFDGAHDGFYTQRDDPRPLSVYGESKLDGERQAQAANARTIIVRTGWVFGPHGRNFLSVMGDKLKRGEPVRAIDDAIGTPTYAMDLAARLRELAMLDLPGIYHVANAGDGVSYFEYVQELARAVGADPALVTGNPMRDVMRPAPRPHNSRLQCLLSPVLGLAPLPPWQESLRKFVAG
ncbi:MAG: dTDP-4-dehydrorhamnose reductase [Pyrinomonadaceae bacterium]